MAGEAGDVGTDAVLLQHVEILREALEAPVDAGAQRVERHALDMGQVAHREVAVGGLAGRDGEAAIAEDRRGDAQRRRGIDERVPGDLRVVVGVAVDDAGRERQPVGLHGLAGGPEIRPDRGDFPVPDAEVAVDRLGPRAVVDFRILDDQVEHVCFLRKEP